MQSRSHSANLGLAGAWHGNNSDSATGGRLRGRTLCSNIVANDVSTRCCFFEKKSVELKLQWPERLRSLGYSVAYFLMRIAARVELDLKLGLLMFS